MGYNEYKMESSVGWQKAKSDQVHDSYGSIVNTNIMHEEFGNSRAITHARDCTRTHTHTHAHASTHTRVRARAHTQVYTLMKSLIALNCTIDYVATQTHIQLEYVNYTDGSYNDYKAQE